MDYTPQTILTIDRLYYEYWTEYLTLERISEHYSICEPEMRMIINLGRVLYNLKAEKKK